MANANGPMSGFRDLLADQMIPRDDILNKIKSVYELYGFVPLKTPALEKLSTLTGKYGEEGDKLMYTFKDNGGRDVAMRYDQTVPLARVVTQYGSQLPKPYKRYALGDVWRGESPQAGRYREFLQFDADIVGSASYLADVEIISMMTDSMSKIDVEATIRVNDRRLLDGLAKKCNILESKGFFKFVSVIDKADKIGKAAVLDEILEIFDSEARNIVEQYLNISGDIETKIKSISELLKNDISNEALNNLTKIFNILNKAGYSEKILFDQTIARGLNYYTGTIFETTLDKLPSIGSVCSGGRFDKLIEQSGGPDLPAVGTSIGVDRLMEALDQLGLLPKIKTNTEVYILGIEDGIDEVRYELANNLRKKGVATEMIYDSGKLGKQLTKVDNLGINKVIIIGKLELEKNKYLLKYLDSGEQKVLSLDELYQELVI